VKPSLWPPPYSYGALAIWLPAWMICATAGGAPCGAVAVPSLFSVACGPGACCGVAPAPVPWVAPALPAACAICCASAGSTTPSTVMPALRS
jgi:hypothetical protein